MRTVISFLNNQNQNEYLSACQKPVSGKADRLEAAIDKGFQGLHFCHFLKAFIHQSVSGIADRLEKLTDWKPLLTGLSGQN